MTFQHMTFSETGLPVYGVLGNPDSPDPTRVADWGERRTVQWAWAAWELFPFPLTSVAPINQLRTIASTGPLILPIAPVSYPPA